MKIMLTALKKHWLFIVFFLIAAALRFYKLPYMASYDFDQEFVTNFVYDVREYPVRLVGQGLSVMGLFMGPLYFYLLVPFYAAFQWQPIGGFVGSVVLGLATIAAYYFVGNKLFSQRVALFAVALRAINYYSLAGDWQMVPTVGSDGLIVLLWYCLYKLWKRKQWYLLPSAAILGMFTSMHPSHFPLWFMVVALLFIWRKKMQYSLKISLVSLFAFLAPSTPLFLFEYWRKWAMTKQLFAIFFGGEPHESQFLTRLPIMTNIIIDFFEGVLDIPVQPQLLGFFALGVSVTFAYILVRKKLITDGVFHFTTLSTLLITMILYYSAFPTQVPEYYLGAVRAMLFLYIPVLLVQLPKVYGRLGWLILIAVLSHSLVRNIGIVNNRWQNAEQMATLVHKERAVQYIVEQAAGREFGLSFMTPLGWNFGFHSLFRVAGHEPVGRGLIYTIVVPKDRVYQDEIDFVSGDIAVLLPSKE